MKFSNTHLLILCSSAFLAMAGGALLAPVLPEMIGPLHTTTQEVGLIMSVYTISTALFTLVLGHIIDRVKRKSILVPCLVIYGLTGLISFFVTDLHLLLILRFIQGIGVSGIMTQTLLIIGDNFKGLESVPAVSKISMSLAIGAISAPLIGGTLALFGWNWPFIFYALAIPFAVLVFVFLPETKSMGENREHKGIIDAFVSLKDIRISYTVFLGFSIYFLLFSMVIYVPFMLKEIFNFASGLSGLMLGIEGIAVIILSSRVRSLTCKYTCSQVIFTGFALVGISLIVMAFLNSIPAIILILLLFGAGYGLAQTAVDVQIINVSPAQTRGGVLSIHTCMKYIGMSLSPIVFGIILIYFNIPVVFILAGVFGLIIAVVTYIIKNKCDDPCYSGKIKINSQNIPGE